MTEHYISLILRLMRKHIDMGHEGTKLLRTWSQTGHRSTDPRNGEGHERDRVIGGRNPTSLTVGGSSCSSVNRHTFDVTWVAVNHVIVY